MSWMCNKQTSVSHSSESEIVSLDAGRSTHGWNSSTRVLGFWLLKCTILLPFTKIKEFLQEDLLRGTSSSKHTNTLIKTPIQHHDLELCNVDDVSSNVKSSQFGAMLYIFEDNEVVIKMIMKGRSPMIKHVSRNHIVALDWFFERINLDPRIHIKYVDTKHQVADILT